MDSTALQSAIVSFTVISLIISIFYADELQESKRKHMLAGAFIFRIYPLWSLCEH